jgi:hypothetical protein
MACGVEALPTGIPALPTGIPASLAGSLASILTWPAGPPAGHPAGPPADIYPAAPPSDIPPVRAYQFVHRARVPNRIRRRRGAPEIDGMAKLGVPGARVGVRGTEEGAVEPVEGQYTGGAQLGLAHVRLEKSDLRCRVLPLGARPLGKGVVGVEGYPTRGGVCTSAHSFPIHSFPSQTHPCFSCPTLAGGAKRCTSSRPTPSGLEKGGGGGARTIHTRNCRPRPALTRHSKRRIRPIPPRSYRSLASPRFISARGRPTGTSHRLLSPFRAPPLRYDRIARFPLRHHPIARSPPRYQSVH